MCHSGKSLLPSQLPRRIPPLPFPAWEKLRSWPWNALKTRAGYTGAWRAKEGSSPTFSSGTLCWEWEGAILLLQTVPRVLAVYDSEAEALLPTLMLSRGANVRAVKCVALDALMTIQAHAP